MLGNVGGRGARYPVAAAPQQTCSVFRNLRLVEQRIDYAFDQCPSDHRADRYQQVESEPRDDQAADRAAIALAGFPRSAPVVNFVYRLTHSKALAIAILRVSVGSRDNIL